MYGILFINSIIFVFRAIRSITAAPPDLPSLEHMEMRPVIDGNAASSAGIGIFR